MHQLAVQKAAHLLHVSPGRGPTQPIAGADLLQQHVDTGGLRSPPRDPDSVSTGETTDAGWIRPPAAQLACARFPAGLVSPGSRTTPTLQAGSSPLSASGSRGAGSPAQPSTAHKAQPGARPLGAGSRSNSPSLLLVGRGLF